MNVHEKLLAIQQKLKAPKSQFNDFGKYYYRSCDDIVEAVKPLCAEFKAVLRLTDEVKEIGDRIYIVACATFTDCESGESTLAYGYAREEESKKGMDLAQITGSCSSYARKYALNGLFCIDDSKVGAVADPDSGRPQDNGHISNKQVAELQALAKQKGVAIEKIVSGYKLKSLADMDTKQWNQAMAALKKRENANA